MGSHEAKTSSFSTEEENDNSSYAMQLLFSGALPMVYGLGTVSKYFVKNENGSSLGPFLDLLQHKLTNEAWYELGAAVLYGGIPFERAHQMPIYKYAGRDQKFNETFNVSMLHQTKMVLAKIIENYQGFENLKTLVDVGVGASVALSVITCKFPNIKGINYDLPHVTEHAPKYSGVKHIGGDMFVSVPEGDVIFMKNTSLQFLPNEKVQRKLLKNCYKALPESGNLIVVDAIIPMNPDNSSSTKHTT
ncbi:hypothetical protein M9H77_14587 [Catharanthus roseus]|uniref:Uncharacterized protein n=1 Tax=Catharanthus roseus TaxID=4058 RepID=A0ACC0BNM7_CATRO|nr:hypothetical protein M9H77_14587 [Catharanthus roseus]